MTETLTFRLSPGEKRALETLAAARVAAAREQGYEIDPSLGAYMRHAIKSLASAAGLTFDVGPISPDVTITRGEHPGQVSVRSPGGAVVRLDPGESVEVAPPPVTPARAPAAKRAARKATTAPKKGARK